MTTLVRGARVLTLDAADTEHAKADIVIEGTMSPRSARSSVARRRRDPYGMNSSSGRLIKDNVGHSSWCQWTQIGTVEGISPSDGRRVEHVLRSH